MKRFSYFLNEARTSLASERAKKLGLVGDQHGGWLDRSGKLVARTVKGQLQFLDGREAKDSQETADSQQSASAPRILPKTVAQPLVTKEKQKSKEQEASPERGSTVTVVFGRFNPPTIGHEKLLKASVKYAEGGDIKIYPSRIQDPKKNPLNPDTKVYYMKKAFPDFEDFIINDENMKSIFDVLITCQEEGYENVNILVGSDRQAEFENLAQKYKGQLYDFNEIRVITAGVFDADSESIEGVSASKMRKAVMNNDFAAFRRGTPKALDDAETRALFDSVRQGMKLKKSKLRKESYCLWEIAPKYDPKNLRENYVKGNIFKLGEQVQNLNTGLVGKIIRRGTNYLICVTEEDIMFKSWIKDVMEYTEVKMDSPMRDKIHPNTLVGTTGAFIHYSRMTPGAVGTNAKYLQPGAKPYVVDLINKYKAKKEKSLLK